jgi:two-component system, cell cycle sensor histidine kinase and response regulator CckA
MAALSFAGQERYTSVALGVFLLAIAGVVRWLRVWIGDGLPRPQLFRALSVLAAASGAVQIAGVAAGENWPRWLLFGMGIFVPTAYLALSVLMILCTPALLTVLRVGDEVRRLRGQEKFHALVQAAPMAVVGADCEGRVTSWNPSAERIFGWTQLEVVGTRALTMPEERKEEQFALLERTLKGEVIVGFESERINRAGERFPVSISTAPLRDEAGRLTGIMATIEDIRERKRIERDLAEKTALSAQLQEQRSNLEGEFRQSQKMELLGQIAGGVAHDFNNMLMVLSGSTELLERALPPQSPASRFVEQIRRTVEKASAITKQLLAFSRKQVLDTKDVDVHEVLTECEFMLPSLVGSDVHLTFQHNAARSWILADSAQLEQAIANLAINARDAMPGGGSLTIATRNAYSLPEDASSNGDGAAASEWLVMEVKDSGCGMDEAIRSHVFEPFFTTKSPGKGTGLGLSTVYGIVRQFNGHIYLDSQPGLGSRFRLFFPVRASPALAQVSAPPANIVADTARGLTVLIADDEPALRSAVVEYLRGAGHQVLESNTSHEALELARSHSGAIDVLITDVIMPGLRGAELAKQVAEFRPGVHVIFISGYAQSLPEAQIPAGAAFLQKPFRFASLAEQLKLVTRKA